MHMQVVVFIKVFIHFLSVLFRCPCVFVLLLSYQLKCHIVCITFLFSFFLSLERKIIEQFDIFKKSEINKKSFFNLQIRKGQQLLEIPLNKEPFLRKCLAELQVRETKILNSELKIQKHPIYLLSVFEKKNAIRAFPCSLKAIR